MSLEILAVGSELLTGSVIDTNSGYVAEQCEKIGLEVQRHTCVGDELKQIIQVLLEISERCDFCIVTGGLGPTFDDLTSQAAAKAAKVELVLFSEALTAIESYFKKFDRVMPEANKKQAFFPQGSQYISNHYGTAPGFSIKINRAQFYFMPGVPTEMKQMLQEQILPQIIKNFTGSALQKLTIKTLKTFGCAEADVGRQLEAIAQDFPELKFGTRAHFPELQIKLYAREQESSKEVQNLLACAEEAVRLKFRDWIFAADEAAIETVIADLLIKGNRSLAILECQSGGVLTDWLTNVNNHADFLVADNVINLKSAYDLLREEIQDPQKLVEQLAKKSRTIYKASDCIAIYGISSDTEAAKLNLPLGTAYVAIADKNGVDSYSCCLSFGNRDYRKKFFAMFALDLLRRRLSNLPFLSEMFGKPLFRSEK